MKNNPIVYLASKMWQFSKGNRPNVVAYSLMQVGANVVAVSKPLILAKFLNEIQLHGVSQQNIPLLLLVLSLFFWAEVLLWAFNGPARIKEMTNAFLVRANYKNYLLGGIVTLPLGWHSEHHSGNITDKNNKGTSAIYDFSEDTFEIIKMFAHLIGAYAVLVYFNIHAAYLVLAMVITAGTIIIRYDGVLVGQYHQLNRIENKIAERIADIINNITTVIILRIENLVLRSIAEKIMSPLPLYKKNIRLNELKWFLVSVCTAITTILVLGSYLLMAVKNHNTIMIGTISALYNYVYDINDLFYGFASIYNQIIRRCTRVMNSEELARDFSLCRKTANGKLPATWKELRIEALSFSYHHTTEGADLHLDDISLTIRSGQRIALVGESGSGKTTLLKIMRELYEPRELSLSIDGRQLDGGFKSISSDITLIPQDPEIFDSTIGENITLGVERDENYVRRFTDMARFTQVVEKLPNGFDSWIKEKGVNLSGGEKQRLALARGLLASSDKQIILLDEPTSSVDTINECEIYRNIFSEFGDKTIISSVHKLHLLSMFDIIYLFNDGRIVASGTFEQLLESSPEFNKVWEQYNTRIATETVDTFEQV